MPIDSTHPDYDKMLPDWLLCRDTSEGERAVKEAGQTYLPILSGQDAGEYAAYKQRAMFYNATSRTIQGLTGLIMRKDPDVQWKKSDLDYLKTVGDQDESLTLVAKQVAEEVVTVGRVGVLVDAPADTMAGDDGEVIERELGEEESQPYTAIYAAENIINWRVEKVRGRRLLTRVVLREYNEVEDPEDPYGVRMVVQYRMLILDHGGLDPFYRVELWEKHEGKKDARGRPQDDLWVLVEESTPRRKGGGLIPEIPFVIINSMEVSPDTEKPPLLDLASVNISHYRTSADLEHGRHFTALPTPYVTGEDPKKVSLTIGSAVAWIIEDSNAKVGMLEFTGEGLGHLAEALKEKEDKMAVLGARLLEEQKRVQEAAETVKLRHSGERSVIASIAVSVAEGLTGVLKWLVFWRGTDEERNVGISLTTDFETSQMSPQMLQELVKSLMTGAISFVVFYHNVQRGELYPEGWTREDEEAAIASGGPIVESLGRTATPDDEADEDDEDDDAQE